MSDSLQPHGLWNSPGQNTGVTAVPFSRGSSQPRSPTLHVNSLPAEPPGKPKNTGVGSLSLPPGDLPDPGIKPESPALQADSLPAELPGKALQLTSYGITVIQMTGALRGTGGTLPTASSYEMPASIMTSLYFLLLSSQIPKES